MVFMLIMYHGCLAKERYFIALTKSLIELCYAMCIVRTLKIDRHFIITVIRMYKVIAGTIIIHRLKLPRMTRHSTKKNAKVSTHTVCTYVCTYVHTVYPTCTFDMYVRTYVCLLDVS